MLEATGRALLRYRRRDIDEQLHDGRTTDQVVQVGQRLDVVQLGGAEDAEQPRRRQATGGRKGMSTYI